MAGADFLAAFVASCLRGALPPVDLRAVCFVRAIVTFLGNSQKIIVNVVDERDTRNFFKTLRYLLTNNTFP